jgi:GABA(A) receptor-associated protein
MDYKTVHNDVKKRKDEFKKIMFNHPNMIPVIIEPADSEHKRLVEHCKYLIPKAYTFQEFSFNFRKKMKLSKGVAVYFVVGGKNMPGIDRLMLDIYKEFKDTDGFLYMKYSVENSFGLKI